MHRHPTALALSALGWLGFVAVSVCTAAFLAGVLVPVTVDAPPRMPLLPAILIDVGVLLLFAIQHSVMARQPVKRWMRRRIPEYLERTTYVLSTELCLVLLLVVWQPWGPEVWRLDGPAAAAIWAVYGVGWLLTVTSTFAVDHLELTGLRQAGWAPERNSEPTRLRTDGLHSIVGHPLMTGLLIVFWATPHMSSAHLLLALMITGYILLGTRFEERELRRVFASDYRNYAARVPAFIPWWRPAWKSASEASSFRVRNHENQNA